MKAGKKLTYIGNGFIGFNKSHTEMIFVMNDITNVLGLWVDYFNGSGTHRILVNRFEVK